MDGHVKWFNRVRGYGYIVPDDCPEQEIWVHYSGIQGEGYRNLYEGQRVSFTVMDAGKGPRAVNVEVKRGGQ